MYQVDERDSVLELENVPQASVGSPMPVLLADEHGVALAYLIQEQKPIWEKSRAEADATSPHEDIAIVQFKLCRAHMFGPPNDEAFAGHPLAGRGLQSYAAFRIENSSWIRQLERMNSVHQYHRPEMFWNLQHLIFAFHDSTFECVCDSFGVVVTHGRSALDAVPEMIKLLDLELR
jgi:hypothetical protein